MEYVMVPGHFNIYQDLILVYVVHWFHLHDALEVVWSVQNFPRDCLFTMLSVLTCTVLAHTL
jgi:hypothetical protein